MNNAIQQGKKGEDLVARKLTREGFKILAQNYRKPFGEIDLIAIKNDLIIFVEVKMRQACYFDLAEVIIPSKQKKIIAVAKAYFAEYNYGHKTGRFDVALVEGTGENTTITYIPNAFMDSNEW